MNFLIRIILGISVIDATASVAAWAGPQESSMSASPRTFSAPVFFRPPDPGMPCDQAVTPVSYSTPGLLATASVSRQPTLSVACLSDIHDGAAVQGWVLLRPLKDIHFTNEFGTFTVSAKSRVLLCAMPHSFTMYNVYDTRNGAVNFVSGGDQVKLLPGHQLTLTSDPKLAGFEMVIPHSRITDQPVANKMHALAANFKITAAMSMVRPLRNDPQVLKSAASQQSAIQHGAINYRE